MKAFAYRRAAALASGREGGARPLAGGTDLLPLLKEGLLAPEVLADLTRAEDGGAGAIAAAPGGGLRLGALVTLAALAADARVRAGYTALAEAAQSSASPQIRNAATLGGNLCQWNRCWYFRGGVPCHLTGGRDCPAAQGDNRHHAIFGAGPCIAVHPSDPAVALLALGASVELTGPAGPRSAPLSDFLRPPSQGDPQQAALEAGEVVAAVLLPPPAGLRSVYEKAMDRAAWAFALASAAVALEFLDGRVARAEIALGGVAAVPWRAEAAAAELRGRPLTAEAARAASARAADGARPLAHNGYKVALVQGLVRSALVRLIPAG